MDEHGKEMAVVASTAERFARRIPRLSARNFEYLIDHHWDMPAFWQACELSVPYCLLETYVFRPRYDYAPLAKAVIAHTMVALLLKAFKDCIGRCPASYEPDQTGRLKYFDLLSMAEQRWGNIDSFVELVRPLMMDAMTKRFGLTEEQDLYMALGKASMMG